MKLSLKFLNILVVSFLGLSCNSPKKNAIQQVTTNNVVVKSNAKFQKIANISMIDFNEITAAATVVIVDFNAVWCGPCKRLTPMLEEFEKEYGDKILVVQVDVDKNPIPSQYFRIESIPLLHFYKNGKLVNQIMGLPEKKELKMEIENLVK